MYLLWLVLLLFFCRGRSQERHLKGIVVADLNVSQDFSYCSFTVDGTATKVTNLTTVGGILANAAAAVPNSGLLFLSLINGRNESFATIINMEGNVTFHEIYRDAILSKPAYDTQTKQFFIISYNPSVNTNYLDELYPNTGQLVQLLKISGIVNVDISSYSSSQHIFYLVILIPDGDRNALIQVDTQAKKLLSTVVVEDAIEILLWDDTSQLLYAWVADETYAGVLVILDLQTGKRAKTIVQFDNFSANGGTAVIDESAKMIYASLVDISNGGLEPVWATVDITTGKYTTQHTDPSIGFPINLVLI